MGENRYLCGETRNRTEVELPGDQARFLDRLIATGRPVILVLCGGRPLALGDRAERCAAIIQAWYPGQAGGLAIADLILGRSEPEGRLTVSMPRSTAQVPISHRRGSASPQFPFGHGLSYTSFRHAAFDCLGQVGTSDDAISVSWEVRNVGLRRGSTVSQVYALEGDQSDLVGFAKVHLEPGTSARITIKLWLEQFAAREPGGIRRIASRSVRIMIGSSACDPHFTAEVRIIGPDRMSQDIRRIFSETRIDHLPSGG